MFGDIRQAELESNHFALLGGTKAPGHRTRRLRKDGRMGRAAAATDSTAATVEQQQLDLMLRTGTHQGLLGAVLRPGRRGGAGVLGRIGIADHHLLRAMQTRTVALQAQ
ncbi:hypothetical protein D9M68_814280 [compost metagenome]